MLCIRGPREEEKVAPNETGTMADVSHQTPAAHRVICDFHFLQKGHLSFERGSLHEHQQMEAPVSECLWGCSMELSLTCGDSCIMYFIISFLFVWGPSIPHNGPGQCTAEYRPRAVVVRVGGALWLMLFLRGPPYSTLCF